MKLEIGMYVRTIKGKIWIINSQQAISGHRKDIINASNNIIDLIEVGDYVNGNRVIEIDNKSKDIFNKYLLVEETDYDNYNISYSNNDIKSIVTKQCFESMEYKVKE